MAGWCSSEAFRPSRYGCMSHPLTIPRPIQHPLSPIATPSLLQSIVLHVATQAHNRPHLLQTPQTDPAVSPLLTTHDSRASTAATHKHVPHPQRAPPASCPPTHASDSHAARATPTPHRTGSMPSGASRHRNLLTCHLHHSRLPWRLAKSDALHRTPPSPTSSTVVRAPPAEHQLRRSARASPTPQGPRCGRAAP